VDEYVRAGGRLAVEAAGAFVVEGKINGGNQWRRPLKTFAIRLREQAATHLGRSAVETAGDLAAMTRRCALGSLAGVNLLALPAAFGEQRDDIRDRQGKLIGTIVHRRDGVREARNRQWRLLGTYNPKSNETRDRLGKLLTKGDSLPALLFREVPGR
jgi:hypothetical protein